MVGRVVDRRRPDLAQAEVAGDRHVARRAARGSARRPPSRSRAPRPAARPGRSSRTAGRPPRAASTARRRCRRPSASARRRTRRAARARRPCGARRRPGSADPASSPDRAQRRPAGQQHALGLDDAGGRSRRRSTRDAVVARAQAGERGPLAQLDAGRLHRQRVGADVARRVDVAVAVAVAAAAMAVGRQRAGDRRRPRPAVSQRTSVRPAACCIATRSRPARSSSSVTARIR